MRLSIGIEVFENKELIVAVLDIVKDGAEIAKRAINQLL